MNMTLSPSASHIPQWCDRWEISSLHTADFPDFTDFTDFKDFIDFKDFKDFIVIHTPPFLQI